MNNKQRAARKRLIRTEIERIEAELEELRQETFDQFFGYGPSMRNPLEWEREWNGRIDRLEELDAELAALG